MKKLSSILCLSTALVATAASATMETYYVVGASAGYMSLNGSFGINDGFVDYPQDSVGAIKSLAGGVDNDSFLYGVFAGLETRCNKWTVGLEFAIDWHTHNSDTFASNTRADVTNPNTLITYDARVNYDRDTIYTLSTRLGYEVCDWLKPYGRIGVETSRDFLDVAVAARTEPFGQVPGFNFGDIGYMDGSNRRWGWVLGVGLEFEMAQYMPNTNLRVEYNYHSRGEGVTAPGFTHFPNPFVPPMTGIATVADAKQHAHSVRASLAYNFL